MGAKYKKMARTKQGVEENQVHVFWYDPFSYIVFDFPFR
jgi:hypothetical protein